MFWVNYSNLSWNTAKSLQPPKLHRSLTRNNSITLLIMAPNYSMSRLVSPSQGSDSNSSPNCFRIHAIIGWLSRGNIITKCSYMHMYTYLNVVWSFTCFFPQNCLPIMRIGFTQSSSALCILWNAIPCTFDLGSGAWQAE